MALVYPFSHPNRMVVGDFSAEALKRVLTLPEAACLWCDMTFGELSSGIEFEPGVPFLADNPHFNHALAALIEATETLELDGGRDEDGYPLPVEHRTVSRDALVAWISTHHPHRPVSLFPLAIRSAAVPGELDVAETRSENYLGTGEVLRVFQVSRSTLEVWMRERGFPAPFQASKGGTRRWRKAEVLAWKLLHERG